MSDQHVARLGELILYIFLAKFPEPEKMSMQRKDQELHFHRTLHAMPGKPCKKASSRYLRKFSYYFSYYFILLHTIATSEAELRQVLLGRQHAVAVRILTARSAFSTQTQTNTRIDTHTHTHTSLETAFPSKGRRRQRVRLHLQGVADHHIQDLWVPEMLQKISGAFL